MCVCFLNIKPQNKKMDETKTKTKTRVQYEMMVHFDYSVQSTLSRLD